MALALNNCWRPLHFLLIQAQRIITHMVSLCTSNLGSRCHLLDTTMKRQRFTADRLCEPARNAQDAAIKEYEKYKEVLDLKIECRYHSLFICQPAAFRVHAPFLFLSLSLSLALSTIVLQLRCCTQFYNKTCAGMPLGNLDGWIHVVRCAIGRKFGYLSE